MNIGRRWIVAGFVLLVILFLGLINWPYVYGQILMPLATTVWLLLRLFVLSIGQQYYWTALVILALLIAFRLLPRIQMESDLEHAPLSNETVNSIWMWRRLYVPGDTLVSDDRVIQQQMSHMLVALHACRLHVQPDFQLYDALRKGDIPLPKQIHDMAFHEEPTAKVHPLKRLIRAARARPVKWIRHATGQDKVEHYRMIDEMLTYLETSLEMNNDSE